MTLEAPSRSTNDNEQNYDNPAHNLFSDRENDRQTLSVPERATENAEPALPYLSGNWEYAPPQVDGQTTIINDKGDYLNLTPEELSNYIAGDQEAAAARATARAVAKAEQARDDAAFTDDERRAEAIGLFAYLDELTSKELAETQPAAEAKTSFGRNILRYFTERDPETGEFSYGSGFLTRSRTPKEAKTEPSPVAELEVTPVEQLVTTEETEQTAERPSRHESIRTRIGRGVEAAKRKLSRSSNDEKQLKKAEKAAAKIAKKAEKVTAKLDKLNGRSTEATTAVEGLRESIEAKKIAKREAEKAEAAAVYDEAMDMNIARDEKIEAGKAAILEAANLRSRKLIEDAIKESEATIARANSEAANFTLSDEATKSRKRFARAVRNTSKTRAA